MLDFYIVKNAKDEPFYKPEDICNLDILAARKEIDQCVKQNKTNVSDYYIVRIEALNKQEILNCIWAANKGQGAKLKTWRILETIIITPEDGVTAEETFLTKTIRKIKN